MTTNLKFQFDFQSIQNHRIFSIQDETWPDVYFLAMGQYVLFMCPSSSNVYLSLSAENLETIQEDFKPRIRRQGIDFKFIFRIDKKDFARFLNTGRQKFEFQFQIQFDNKDVIGICNLLNHEKRLDGLQLPRFIYAPRVKEENIVFQDLLDYLFFKKFNFKEVNPDTQSLNLKLSDYSRIDKYLKSFDDCYVWVKFAKDQKSGITSIFVDIDDYQKIYTSQILIYQTSSQIKNLGKNRDLLAELRHQLKI